MKLHIGKRVLCFGTPILSISVMVSCGGGRELKPKALQQNIPVEVPAEVSPLAKEIERITVSTITSSAESQPHLTSPRPILLNATNLAIIHSRLIPVNLSEWTAEEKFKLGEFVSAVGPAGNADRISYGQGAQMSQDYIWAVRRVAGKTCQKLLDDSLVLSSGSYALRPERTGYALVIDSDWSQKKISRETIQAFAAKIFGYAPAGVGAFHAGVEDLQAIFNASVASATNAQKDERMKANYMFLCVSVLSDPRVFTR